MGKNNSGRGVGGSMVHYAGYCPAISSVRLRDPTRDGVGADWPISYAELRDPLRDGRAGTAGRRPELAVGRPAQLSPSRRIPVSGAASVIWEGALSWASRCGSGRSGIVNGTFGNRPHCIYRGFCLQGCKVNAKASPYVTHLPDALAHGVEIRAELHGRPGRGRRSGGQRGGRHLRPRGRGGETVAAGRVVAVCGYSIETPRLLLQLDVDGGFPHGLGNNEDQVGRYVMVQGATQTAGRYPDELRMYKAPPPEVSSEAVL